ncbi:MAG: hypothetical protein U0R81_08670 [Mycobacterium sp.]
MSRNRYVVGAAAVALALTAAACGHSSDTATTKTETKTVTETSTATSGSSATSTSVAATTSATAADGPVDVQSLIPTPANAQRTDGPDQIGENGVHQHFGVAGAPTAVMDAYKAALEAKGWTVSVLHTGGGGGGGGATYTGTNGGAYGVFTGGGYGDSTDLDACAWPSKPANPNCGSRGGN